MKSNFHSPQIFHCLYKTYPCCSAIIPGIFRHVLLMALMYWWPFLRGQVIASFTLGNKGNRSIFLRSLGISLISLSYLFILLKISIFWSYATFCLSTFLHIFSLLESIIGKHNKRPGKYQRSRESCQDLCWKVHDRARSFVLSLYTIHELHNQNVSIG